MAMNSVHAEVMQFCSRAQHERGEGINHDPRECGKCSRLLRLRAAGKMLSQEMANRIDVNQAPLRKNETFFLPPAPPVDHARCPICATTWPSPEPLNGVCNRCNVEVERGAGVRQAPAVQLTLGLLLFPRSLQLVSLAMVLAMFERSIGKGPNRQPLLGRDRSS